ncbi:MAG: tetratricopeptide repeat protein [Treponema sp.]|jgi:tetratricopeptide (TPR) repeat protein|nr:tetratricopeptide repeat protein [Treponema sp.]
MKKIIFSVVVFLFLMENVGIVSAEDQDSQSRYMTDQGAVDVRTIDPTEMVRPSENERARTLYNMGTDFMRQNRLEEAENYLREAIALDPEFVDAMDHLGIVYRRQNRLEEAEEMYLRSIGLNDKNKVPFMNLAVVYRIQGRLNDALGLYRKVIEINQNDPEGYYGIGELFFIAGSYEIAMPFFDRALELYINLSSSLVYDVYYYKGMISYIRNEFDDALRYLEEARIGNPNNETIERIINEIRNRRG